MEIAIGIILILASIFLIIAVLMQEGKSRNLSGAIGGGSSDTFLGKSGVTSLDKKLSSLTTIVAVVFVILVVVMYLLQDTSNFSGIADSGNDAVIEDVVPEDTAADAAETNASVDGTTAAAEG